MAGLRKRGSTWSYRYVDGAGVKRERKGTTDKRVTLELARAAENEAARIKAGLDDPKAKALRGHGARPLSEHLEAWRKAMLAKGSTPSHVNLTINQARRVVALVKCVPLTEA